MFLPCLIYRLIELLSQASFSISRFNPLQKLTLTLNMHICNVKINNFHRLRNTARLYFLAAIFHLAFTRVNSGNKSLKGVKGTFVTFVRYTVPLVLCSTYSCIYLQHTRSVYQCTSLTLTNSIWYFKSY